MELVSPIFTLEDTSHWHLQLSDVWGVLTGPFNTTTSNQCSTHIHTSPADGAWKNGELRNVAKAVVYFERAIDALMPPARRTNIWCQSNRYNCTLRDYTMVEIFQRIDATQTAQDVAGLMCAFSKHSTLGKSKGADKDFVHNTFRWNFESLVLGSKGTIEFRQPPGSCKAVDSRSWIEFACSFLQAAVLWGDSLDPQQTPNLEMLRTYVLNGARRSSIENLNYLENIFQGKVDLPFGPYDLTNITEDDLNKFIKKADELNITVEKFKMLFGYK